MSKNAQNSAKLTQMHTASQQKLCPLSNQLSFDIFGLLDPLPELISQDFFFISLSGWE